MVPQLQFLEQIKYNLDAADFGLIQQAVADMRDKFAPIARIPAGTTIDRVRINKSSEVFTRIDQVKHITDKDVLNKFVDFGRANLPKQAMFYGSVITPDIRLPRATAWLETTSIFDTQPLPNELHEIFTVSRWIVRKEIDVIEMIFSDEALKVNELVRRSFDTQTKVLFNLNREAHYREQARFFSNEFARNDCKGLPHNYKISAAYTNYVLAGTGVSGITYPSVPTEYKGHNVALLPHAVETCLELEKVVMMKFDREKGDNLPVDSIKLAKDLGVDKMDFQWVDYIGREEQAKL